MRDSWLQGQETVVSHVDIVAGGSSAPSDHSNYTRLSSGCKGRLSVRRWPWEFISIFLMTHPVCQSTVVERDVRSLLSASKYYYSNTVRASRAVIASEKFVWCDVSSTAIQFAHACRDCQYLWLKFKTIFIESVAGSAQVILAHTVHPFGLQNAYMITYFFDSG